MRNKILTKLTPIFACSALLVVSGFSNAEQNAITFPLEKNLLVIKEDKGFLACAYIDVETCNKLGEACAIVSGVNNYEDMKKAKVIKASKAALDLGVQIGDSGKTALSKFSN